MTLLTANSIVFACEVCSFELLNEIETLSQEYSDEITFFSNIKPSIDKDFYAHLQKFNNILAFTARQENKLVGFATFFVSNHPHHKDSRQAFSDTLFLKRNLRQGWTGYQFIKFCSNVLTSEGNIEIIHITLSLKNNFGKLLQRLHYKPTEVVYAKKIN